MVLHSGTGLSTPLLIFISIAVGVARQGMRVAVLLQEASEHSAGVATTSRSAFRSPRPAVRSSAQCRSTGRASSERCPFVPKQAAAFAAASHPFAITCAEPSAFGPRSRWSMVNRSMGRRSADRQTARRGQSGAQPSPVGQDRPGRDARVRSKTRVSPDDRSRWSSTWATLMGGAGPSPAVRVNSAWSTRTVTSWSR